MNCRQSIGSGAGGEQMAQTMRQSGAAVQYARAILDLADEKQQARAISQALKKDAIVHQYVDEKIIGGMVLRVDDKLIDASVKSQLEAMKRQLLAATPRGI